MPRSELTGKQRRKILRWAKIGHFLLKIEVVLRILVFRMRRAPHCPDCTAPLKAHSFRQQYLNLMARGIVNLRNSFREGYLSNDNTSWWDVRDAMAYYGELIRHYEARRDAIRTPQGVAGV